VIVLVFVEQSPSGIEDLSLQALAFGRTVAAQLGVATKAVVAGEPSPPTISHLSKNGIGEAFSIQSDQLSGYVPRGIARGVSSALSASGDAAVIAVGSEHGNEVMAHLAAMLDQPLAADVLSFSAGSPATVTRSRWGGSLIEHAELVGAPLLMTVAAHAIAAGEVSHVDPKVTVVAPDLTELDTAVNATIEQVKGSSSISLADAKVVVSGGRGVGGSEGFAVLEELAALLGGTVGCSRVVTSAGWRPHTDQVGQTGTKVSPDLYIACGISGATQHLAGCRTSKTMLVINNDPEASIMAHADYAVIGDLHTVLPAIVAEVRKS